jgi:hypothetical protein
MPKKGNNKPEAPKKERSAALLKLNQERVNAAKTFKERDVKYSLKDAAALIKHRREGKSNDEFFATLASGESATAVNLASGAAAATAKPKKNKTVKKSKASGAAAAVATGFAESEAEALATGAAAAAAAESGHVAAGKKAETSEKGAAWIAAVKAAKKNLNKNFEEVGLTTKPHQMNAMRLASTRRNRPQSAERVRTNIIATAQGEAFARESAAPAAAAAPKKASKKTAKKTNNSVKVKNPFNNINNNTRRNNKPGGNGSNPFNMF